MTKKEINSKIEANEYIFASITISEGEYIWPISFDLLFIPGDTISINTKNVNMFISQLLVGVFFPSLSLILTV